MNTSNNGMSFSLAFAVAAMEAHGIKGANMYHTGWDCVIGPDQWSPEETVRKNAHQYEHHFEIPEGEHKGRYIIQVVIIKETDISKAVRTRTYEYTGLFSMQGPAEVLLKSNNTYSQALGALPDKLTVSNKSSN